MIIIGLCDTFITTDINLHKHLKMLIPIAISALATAFFGVMTNLKTFKLSGLLVRRIHIRVMLCKQEYPYGNGM